MTTTTLTSDEREEQLKRGICHDGECCAQCCLNPQHEHYRVRKLTRELAAIVDIATNDDPGTALTKLRKVQSDTATQMRDKCVEKLREMAESYEAAWGRQALREAARELESLTLNTEKAQ